MLKYFSIFSRSSVPFGKRILKIGINLWLGFPMLRRNFQPAIRMPRGKWTLIDLFVHSINIYWFCFVPVAMLILGLGWKENERTSHRLEENICKTHKGFPGGSDGKESTCNVGDLGSISELGRSPGEGKGYPLQYSGLENSMDWGAW